MRGKVPRCSAGVAGFGITPAYAGKRVALHLHIGFRRDHPRLCGEKEQRAARISGILGSPPPMRGKGHPLSCFCYILGITPAYAGKSLYRSLAACGRWDHPRLCGEKHNLPPHRNRILGITPAYAGKRIVPFDQHLGDWDHPRLCGEKSLSRTGATITTGSPPPMRGKAGEQTPETMYQRITPAYAGKRQQADTSYRKTEDHPRLCGEKRRNSDGKRRF